MVNPSQIRKKMPVVDSRGNYLGTVDRVDNGAEIKLARADSPDGLHHYIPLRWVAAIDGTVRLSRSSAEVMRDRD